jgi:hypothetical protein
VRLEKWRPTWGLRDCQFGAFNVVEKGKSEKLKLKLKNLIMAEQAHSSTEIGESGDKTNIQEMLLELMKEMRGQFQDIRKDREQDRVDTKQEFQEMREQFEKVQSEIKQNLKVVSTS